MDSTRVFPCMVCHRPHFISQIDKKKMLLKYIDGNIDIISHISEYNCLKDASTSDQYLTTRLQYRTLRFLRAILSILNKLGLKHSVHMPLNPHPYISGPLTCEQRSHFFIFLCREIIRNSYLLGEHFLNIDTDENAWRSTFDETVQLVHRINKSLWTYSLMHHPRNCRDCSN